MNPPDLARVAERQFMPSFEMLQQQIEKCPEELWTNSEQGPPLWLQLYHVLFGVQVWFGETREYTYPDFGKPVTPVFEDEQGDFLSRDELAEYAEKIKLQAEAFFAKGGEHMLSASLIFDRFTNLDAVLEQLRHITYHVARINGLFREKGVKPVGYKYFF